MISCHEVMASSSLFWAGGFVASRRRSFRAVCSFDVRMPRDEKARVWARLLERLLCWLGLAWSLPPSTTVWGSGPRPNAQFIYSSENVRTAPHARPSFFCPALSEFSMKGKIMSDSVVIPNRIFEAERVVAKYREATQRRLDDGADSMEARMSATLAVGAALAEEAAAYVGTEIDAVAARKYAEVVLEDIAQVLTNLPFIGLEAV